LRRSRTKACQRRRWWRPTFNDIWAMAHPLHNHMRIEGNNTLPFWQNLWALAHMLSLMRNG
jgi:hypothetical protein